MYYQSFLWLIIERSLFSSGRENFAMEEVQPNNRFKSQTIHTLACEKGTVLELF
jgi:hypothetical protein